MEQVVLVDGQDNEVGIMEKLQAHAEGRLHRAISVFIFNTEGELLLQQRASGKYHSANLWTNTCCSHPRPGEEVHSAAERRLMEEMGMKCEVKEVTSFIYKASLDHDLTEYEFDHVFTGVSDAKPVPDSSEVRDWKYITKEALLQDLQLHPDDYTEWFKICIEDMSDKILG